MSVVDSVVSFLGSVSPFVFIIAASAGVISRIIAVWSLRRKLNRSHIELAEAQARLRKAVDKKIALDLEGKELELLKAYIAYVELTLVNDEPIKKSGAELFASKVARLGEYLTNYSPIDKLSKEVTK